MKKRLASKIDTYEFKGIKQFYDITRVMEDNELVHSIVKSCDHFLPKTNDIAICGIESRGFIFGSQMAYYKNVPFYMLRKDNKLPNCIKSDKYDKEYGSGDILCISKNAKIENKTVLIVDDSVATGGTLEAAIKLVEKLKPKKILCFCLLKLNLLTNENILNRLHYIITENDILPKPILNICSESEIKTQAVMEAFGNNYNYKFFNAPSGVNTQPIGAKETIKGAQNRLEFVKNVVPSELIVSIENGIVRKGTEKYDIAYIILSKGEHIFSTWSSMVPLGDIIVNPEKETIGDIINPENPKDPHSKITKGFVSRKDILIHTLKIVKGLASEII